MNKKMRRQIAISLRWISNKYYLNPRKKLTIYKISPNPQNKIQMKKMKYQEKETTYDEKETTYINQKETIENNKGQLHNKAVSLWNKSKSIALSLEMPILLVSSTKKNF